LATFTNYATLSYNGVMRTSNTVTGEFLETLSGEKTALTGQYNPDRDITYVISLVNSGTTALSGLTVTDDMGGYSFGTETLYPLEYKEGSLRYYVGGVLQATPAVTAGPPMVISGISVPAGGNAILIYEAEVTDYAPLTAEATVTNTATVSGGGLVTPLELSETVVAGTSADLSISKAISPATVTENGQLTYTFVIENLGNTAAVAADNIILADDFNPILDPITVTYNGTVWSEGTNYTYDETTGEFETLPGQITVPAASFTQNEDGTWTVVPGTAVVVVSGTV